MRIFGEPAASHYCSAPIAVHPPLQSFRDYSRSLQHRASLTEGSAAFDEYRSLALREADRCVLLAASHYRRTLDLLIPTSAPWACVTAYYGCWFAANALLLMFGCTVFNKKVVDVDHGAPGSQRLVVRSIGPRAGQQQSTFGGSHERFWDLFYTAIAPMISLVDPPLRFSLTPISNDRAWLAGRRNEINYDTYRALRMVEDFGTTFDSASFPGSLPGHLSTLYLVLEGLLEVVFGYSSMFGVRTDALSSALGGSAVVRKHVNDHVYSVRAPNVVRKTLKSVVASRGG